MIYSVRTKSRLTVTLSKELLRRLDQLVDKKEIRNRSHAIELLVTKSLTPKINTAVILAGGKKKEIFAPLATIDGNSLIQVTIERLKKFGFENVVVCAGKNEDKIKKELGSGKRWNISIVYAKETKDLGTAGALVNARKFIKSDPFLVVHADILTGINLEEFIAFHEREDAIATIAVKPRLYEKKYGKLMLEGNRITEFTTESGSGISIVNTGTYLFNAEIFEFISKKFPLSLENNVFPALAKAGKLAAFLFQGIWFDISTKHDLQEAQKRWKFLHSEGR